ncbi:MAG: SPOR domain-containing protein [Gemmatimonadota bacterium]|nr:SPOR domain-containing protein [Gemmatimonadota bacterium]
MAAAVLAAAGCDGRSDQRPERRADAPAPQGTALVVGRAAEEWGLLALPRDGGPAQLRDLASPDRTVREGGTRLPPVAEARHLEGALVALAGPAGRVFRYDVARDSVTELGRIARGELRLRASGEGAVAWAAAGAPDLLALAGDRRWEHEASGNVLWAGAIHDGVAVLAEAEGRATLQVIPHSDATAPPETGGVGAPPPGLVAGWGRRLVFRDDDDPRALVALAVESLEPVGRARFDGPITALAASPSSHEIYAAIADPPAIFAVNRFAFTVRRLATLPATAREIRPSLFGEALLVTDGEAIWRLPVSGGLPVEVRGTWAGDLPLGLPDGGVLSRTADGLRLVAPGGGSRPLEAPADAWWVPVRWVPPVPRPDVAEAGGPPADPGRRAPRDALAAAEGERTAPDGAGPPEELPPAEGGETGPPPGYYAIVGSARQPEGIERLVTDLSEAGFPVAVQTIRDLAGETWHRGLVGPFATRAEADAAARQLQRERRLQSWVTGIEPDA